MDIGFIGVGSMGAAMVPHLVQAGHRVSVWNRNPEPARALTGVHVLDSPVEAFAQEFVLTMLADDRAVRSVILDSGALAAARPACVHVMMATISLDLVRELETAHRAAGVAYVAAPVFGVPAAAARALLNIVVAGEAGAVERATPVLQLLGQRLWPLGDDPVRANVAKLGGNLMLALAIEAMGEATALTASHGLPAADFLEIMTSTLFAAPSYQRYGGFIATNTFEPGFRLPLGLKDVKLALDAAAAGKVRLPAGEVARDQMQTALDRGLESRDWSVFATVLAPKS